MTLFRQHARNEAISTLIWAVVLGLTGFFTTYVWDVLHSSGSLAELQKTLESAQGIVKSLIDSGGASLVTIDGWIQGYVLGSWVSFLYVTFTALFVAGMVTREMDRRTMEFILALPISRTQFLISRWLVLAGALLTIHLVHLMGVVSALVALGQAGSLVRYALAVANSFLLYLFLGSLMLLVSLFVDDYGTGTGVLLGIGMGLNILYLATADAAGALKSLHELLPFSLYDVQAIITDGDVPWGHMAILGAGALLFLALAVRVFQRKPIAV